MSALVKNGDYHRQHKIVSLLWKEGTSAYDITISSGQSVMKQHLATILSADGWWHSTADMTMKRYGVSPDQLAVTHMLPMLQCIPMILEDRTFDELQHETCLCHATVPVIVHQDVKTECAHHMSWDFMPEKKRTCGCKHVSCHNSQWLSWQFLCQAVNILI